jgi:exosortase
LLVLFGLVLYLAGPAIIRITWLPMLYLIFAVPVPEMMYSRVAFPLQNLAAMGSMLMLKALGVDITNDASALHLISRTGVGRDLTVAEACSGMHLLMAFLALGVAMAYLDYKPIWQRLIVVAAGIPIAIFCNVLRVAITAWMYYIDKPEMGQDFMHHFTGVLMLIPALAMLWFLAWILKLTLVEVDDEEPEAPTQAKG